MSSLNEQFGTKQIRSITCTITVADRTPGLPRQSTAVDNTSNLFFDALVSVKVKTHASAASTRLPATCWCYAYATVDGGTTYTDGVTAGSDGSFTPTVPTNLKLS